MNTPATEELVYEELVGGYETALLTQLRGKRTRFEFLEMWVPDEDPVRSILNMVEAAAAAGREEFALRVRNTTLSEARHEELRTTLSTVGEVDLSNSGSTTTISVRGIRS